VDNLRNYQLQQLQALRDTFKEHGLNLHTSANPGGLGAFALLLHDDAQRVRKDLKAKGVNVDARRRAVRFGPDLLNTKEEFMKAAQVVSSVV
jgi:kynureninase